ncbi:MAG: NAD(P)H-quinone oxidoreductase [Proteobacteria bacterium]|nr:NAD(P)H-quinone oxidoreductase [Pseudomonadota bacterium]
MQAILVDQPGKDSTLRLGEASSPPLQPGSIRLRVAAAGVNRADLMQRAGLYPPPPGASELLGLECAGEVIEVAEGVSAWRPGMRAMALLAGGGYAQEVVVDAGSCMPIPEAWSFAEAAAVPEVFLTVFLNVFRLGGLEPGGTALVHGGGSGIGTAAIQLIRAGGARSIVTAGSDEKCGRCRELGADVAVQYRREDFVAAAREATDGRGVDVILDSIGADYFERNLQALAVGGRLVLIGLMSGAKAEIPLGALLVKRLQVIGSTLRARPAPEKAELVTAFLERFGGDLQKGRLRPIVDRVLPLAEADQAHRAMKASEHFGKIILEPPA